MSGPWVVTGCGVVSAAGDTPEAVMNALVRGVPLGSTREDDRLAAAAIAGFDPKRYVARRWVNDLSRMSQLACAAAAGNATGTADVPVEEVGVVLGTAWGSLDTVIAFEREAVVQGPRFVDPILFTETVSNVPAGQVAILYGWSAFNATLAAGSASGLAALLRALEFLDEGRGQVAIAGGCDALSVPLLRSLRARGEVASRLDSLPFGTGRTGRIPGEGAAFLTLESDEHARERGAAPVAAVRATAGRFSPGLAHGGASASEALTGLFRELLDRSGLEARDVDVIVASACGDPAGDAVEAAAVLEVFGEQPSAPPVVVPKAILGETWGASGALAAIVAVEAMRGSLVPGAPNGFAVEPAFSGLHVPADARRGPVRHALVFDRSDHGQQLGLVLSAGNARGDRI